ncbi:hypothetical protein CDIK_0438 [Cucumispora dikerogammari]|nr:hypothetical protein CDIK_0438 [Cucumispora dikerogammari]
MATKSKELRKEYANYFLNDLTIEDKYIIFIDESSFNLPIRRNYGRSKTGTRATTVVPTSMWRNLSLISSINREKVLYSVVIEGGRGLRIFKQFLLGLLPVFSDQGLKEQCVLFYDNVSIYHAREIKNSVEENGLRRRFLSP